MKVLFLTNIPAPYRVAFFNELGRLCELTVLYECKYASDRNKEWYVNEAKNFKEVFLKGYKIGSDNAISFSVINYLKDKSYDLVVVGGYSTPTGMLAISYLRGRRIPFILNCDGGIIKDDNFLKKVFKKFFISSASGWLSTGSKSNEYLVHYGAKKDKIFVYPFTSISIDDVLKKPLDKLKKHNIKNELGIKEEKVIISVGQFIHRKGFDVLLNAVKNVSSDCGIYIVGGEPTDEYLSLRNRLNLRNVHFIEFKAKDELRDYYLSADIFVLPTREDIWGLVINEAMSYGLPVITTDKCVAGIELIRDNENGFITPVGDYKYLADKISDILGDDNLQQRMSENSLKKIKGYTIENMALKHIDIFTGLIEG